MHGDGSQITMSPLLPAWISAESTIGRSPARQSSVPPDCMIEQDEMQSPDTMAFRPDVRITPGSETTSAKVTPPLRKMRSLCT
ncbi:hypothetical protein ABW43_02365 [Stenotrophomonas maltophilia]|nr:hypothetical protein ABW43_02365 [Stenotrophomonas maltophilia]